MLAIGYQRRRQQAKNNEKEQDREWRGDGPVIVALHECLIRTDGVGQAERAVFAESHNADIETGSYRPREDAE